ncbi:MAG TPA: hypothetical protein VFH22_01000 [Rhodocyclaceae bacterium]|nr:hypothetical protein [Rhodocyclaceae bacterium]
MRHLFVDISSHGFGHLAQTAPILNCLGERLPGLRLTVRSALPRQRIAARLRLPFEHLDAASDFGFVMIDPLRIDLAATAERYRRCHRDWPAAVAEEARQLREVGADFVLSNASYRPLAGAALAGIPAAACCSLNWSELFEHFFGDQAWAPPIGREIAAAYGSAPFLALQPAMPMAALPSLQRFPPVAERGIDRRAEIEARWPAARGRRLVLVGFGGIAMAADAFDVAAWARRAREQGTDCCGLVPEGWAADDADCLAIDRLGLGFSDLLASCDAVISKPGYGTFVEAACAGTPVLWLRRADWPEQDCLIDWLDRHGVARELPADELAAAEVAAALGELWRRAPPPRPVADGAAAVADWLITHGRAGR